MIRRAFSGRPSARGLSSSCAISSSACSPVAVCPTARMSPTAAPATTVWLGVMLFRITVSPAVGTTPVFQLAPGEPVGRCGSGPVCLRVGKQTRSFQRAGAQAAPLTVGRRQCGLHQLQLHATERYGHPQFPRWDIRYSDIHFLQKCRAHYAVCTIPWQASFDWHAGNRTPNAHVGGSEGHRRIGWFHPFVGPGLRRGNRCIDCKRNRCGDGSNSTRWPRLAARTRCSWGSINERGASWSNRQDGRWTEACGVMARCR